MIVVDTSAWVEYLRRTDSAVCRAVRSAVDDDLVTCDAVTMELLAGARDERHLGQLRAMLARTITVATTPADYEDAAALYRVCRRNGETVRKLIDCLIAAVALRIGAEVLHADADFVVLARHAGLSVHPAST